MHRAIHFSWISLTLLLLAACGMSYYLGWTESGFRLVAAQLNGKLGPVTMQIHGARGTLVGGVKVDQLIIDHRRVHLEFYDIQGSISMLPLLWQTLQCGQVNVGRALIQVPPHVPGPSKWNERFLPAWMSITSAGLHIDHALLIVPNGSELEMNDVDGSGYVHSRDIRIYSSTLLFEGVHVQGTGVIHAATSIGLRGSLRFDEAHAGAATWTSNAAINGNLDRLALTVNFLEPFLAQFHGVATHLTEDWGFQGQAHIASLDPHTFGGPLQPGPLSGTLNITNHTGALQARGELTPTRLDTGAFAVDFDGSVGPTGVSAQHLELTQRSTGASVEAHGEVRTGREIPVQVAISGHWHDLRWPLNGAAPTLWSGGGDFGAEGSWPLKVRASGDLHIPGLAPLQASGSGVLASNQITLSEGSVGAYGGQASVTGTAQWLPALHWQAAGHVSDLDINALRPGIPGRLGLQFQADGAAHNAHVAWSGVTGTIKGQRASGHGAVQWRPEVWTLQDVRMQLGATRLQADGQAGKDLDLNLRVDTDDLALLHEGAHGQLQAHAHVGGSAENPLLEGNASASGLRWDKLGIASLTASIDFNPRDAGRADSQIVLHGLSFGDEHIDTLRFSSTGPAQQHQLQLDAELPQATLAASGSGSFSNGQWHIELSGLQAGDKHKLHLALEAPVAVLIAPAAQHYSIERTCLKSDSARFCGSASSTPAQAQFQFEATSMPLAMLTEGLIDATDFEGTVSAEVNGSATAHSPWIGAARLTLADAQVHHHFRSGRVENFTLGTGTVNATLGEDTLTGQVLLDSGAAGSIKGQLSASGAPAAWLDWPLDGQLHMETTALDFIGAYATEIDRASGRLTTDLKLAGALRAPRLTGDLALSDAKIDAYLINLSLRDVNLKAHLGDSSLTLDGSAAAGVDGQAAFSGNLSWDNGISSGVLKLSGQNLKIIDLPVARVIASPNVELKLNGRRIDVSGTVDLPYARIDRPDALAGAVTSSSDERMVGPKQSAPSDPYQVFGNVKVTLGDRVTINVFGLTGRLSGGVTTVADESGITRASGDLTIEEGKYNAYSRQLDIERGKLYYNNTPLDDPAIDVRATKEFPDILAGVNVRGTLRSPRISFFSEPPVSQTQIVSLLFAGGSLDSLPTTNTTDAVARANGSRDVAIGEGGALLAQQLGSKIGLEAGVESDLDNDPSLVIGRYITPRLYVGYGVGLLEAINTVKLRYTVGDHWTVKTEAGQVRSADLIFSIQK
jgi:translocation and assembly module TamB